MGLYANVRPVISYSPSMPLRHSGMNVLAVHENEEELYAGIEHRKLQKLLSVSKSSQDQVMKKFVNTHLSMQRHTAEKESVVWSKTRS